MLKNRLFWIVAFIGVLVDRLTKSWIVQNFEPQQSLPLWSGVFHLTYTKNSGAAWSLFHNGVWWLRWLSLGFSLVVTIFVLSSPRMSIAQQLGWGCILAGAVGNGIDRFLLSYVIDFLDFRLIRFPIFNVADVLINIGIIFLFIASFQDRPPKREKS